VITWRNLAYDLRLLSSNALGYPLFYILGFGAYMIQMGATGNSNLAAPLFALSLCVLTHVASERADRVADQITIEHGGRRRRLLARMASIGVINVGLVSLGLVTIVAMGGWSLQLPEFWLFTAVAVIALFATAGVVIAAALPHPALSLALTSLVLFAGGTGHETNLFSRSLNQMMNSTSILVWTREFSQFCLPWITLALLALPLATGRVRALIPRLKISKPFRKFRIPAWVANRPSFAQVSLRQFTTNPIPALGILIGMAVYTLGTVSLASRLAELSLGGNYLPAFTGLVLVNVIPAVILGLSVQRREVDDQESFLFGSRQRARQARVMQTSVVVFLSTSAALLWIAQITDSPLGVGQFIRMLVVIAALAPALSKVGIKVVAAIRTPLILTLVSYALTLPEMVVVWLAPDAARWLPSSLISAAAGGPGAYLRPGSETLSEWVALAFVGLLAASAYPIRRKVSA
jgi:hypothetical protein